MTGIYVHVPFCISKCTYCDFASYPKENGKQEAYFACLYREMKGRAKQLGNRVFGTVYFGGGTPSFVPAEYISGALKLIHEYFPLCDKPEITLEVNPKTLTADKIKTYEAAGINRYSIGLQSASDKELARLNRVHTAEDFLKTCELLRDREKSADILIGLHDQTIEGLLHTIDFALEGGVSHISMYALTPEVGTPIYTDYLNGELPDGDEVADLYDAGRSYLAEKGFKRYEVSNFALPGHESRHNYNYWQRGEYIGFGVSASSFIDGRRFTNSFSIDEYNNTIIYGKFPEISSESVTAEDARFESIMLALRTEKGLNINSFNALHKADFLAEYADMIKKQNEYLLIENGYVRIKPEYLYVQNRIIIEFMK